MKNHINELFNAFTPKEDQKSKIFHKILNERDHGTVTKRKYSHGFKGFLRPAIACMLCLLISVSVFIFGGGGNSFMVYAYGENVEITNTGVQLSTGLIHDDGEMRGQLLQMYIKGENIKTIRFSCKNQYIDFTDWTESRLNFSMEKQFTVTYGKKTSDYGYLVVNWNPENTIRQLTDTANSSIAKLSQALRNDIIVMEVVFIDGKKETKAIGISLEDNGNILAKLQDYKISQNDDFILKPQSDLPAQPKINIGEELSDKVEKYSKEEIENAKNVAREYYSRFSGDKKINSIEYTENSPLLSSGIPDKYKDWNIIAFKVHEKSMEPNILRTILLAKEADKNDWVVINEGY
ncbi:hypothetical protein [Clostridium sp.]|uniref:hypothetical protein n=1 Tax=Clostridium sp. TaxID=1506 RepID=UPI001A3DBC12|nr:hypothetical protein [Clostridium sp.]MBK5235596.1 hypothetical protein [Clostridium sp.]